jgi:hypothetical protein
MPQLAPVIPIIAAGIGAVSAGKARKEQRRSAAQAAEEARTQLEFQKAQMALLEEQKQRYREFEFTNPYAGMENVFEDITVNQQAARFQAEQGAQQRANIMQTMRGAAGSSGIAGLAQALAGQGALQARQISADISRQEQANQLAQAQGAQAVDLAKRGGEQMIQEAEMSRQSTLLGIQFQGAAGAQAARQQALANQMAMQQAGMQMQMQNAQAFTNVATAAVGTEGFWD